MNVISATWKVLPAHGAAPDVPLLWSVDPFGMLWLDQGWIAPAKYVDMSKLDACAKTVHNVCFEVPMEGELPEIIISRELVEMPSKMEAFLADIEAICRKHGFSISHEDNQGGFWVELLKEDNLGWLSGAAKQYTRAADPATGALLAPALMGRECPGKGGSCWACQFKDYCFNPYDKRAAAQLQELLKEV